MDYLQIEKLKSAVVIMGEGFARAAEDFRAAAAAFEANSIGIDTGNIWDDEKLEPYAELLRRIGEFASADLSTDMADLADAAEDIPPPKKIPRPAKYIGPVNKANYAANRPPRRARSSCRIIKR